MRGIKSTSYPAGNLSGMNNLQRTQIVDKNGKLTHVHKKTEFPAANKPRTLPTASSGSSTHAFRGFNKLPTGDSSKVMFTNGEETFEVYYLDDDPNTYLRAVGEDGETIATTSLFYGEADVTFPTLGERDYFVGLGDEMNSQLREIMGEFQARNFGATAYLRVPESIDPREAHPASDYIGERLEGGEYGTDPIYARADYAEVSEEGIAYGININNDYFGEVFAGRKRDDETDEEYEERKLEAAHENWAAISEYLEETYDAYVGDGNGDDYSTVEFYVEYEDGGPKASSTEYMGDRAESETKLLDFRNDYDYGSAIQNGLAKKLGYRWELTTNADRQVGDGYWVKDAD